MESDTSVTLLCWCLMESDTCVTLQAGSACWCLVESDTCVTLCVLLAALQRCWRAWSVSA
eukprot:6528139-Pyramimonas_sp.AAC.1